MRPVYASIMAVLLITSLGSLSDVLGQSSKNNRPGPGQNNVWYAADDRADTVIVFVHGLASDSRDAWFYEGDEPNQNAYWPELVRADPKLAGSAIFLGGYHTALDSHDYDFRDAANELYRSLKISIDPATGAVLDKPNILFVTHSAGGIVVRHMLIRETDSFKDKTVGLLLIASPSNGARDADRLAFVADWVRSKQGHQLAFDNPFLESLDKDFKKLVYEGRIPRLSGAEWLEHRLIYSKYFGMARDEVLVEPESGGRYFSEPIRLHETDHISIVKPSDPDHRTYREFRFFYETDFLKSVERSNKVTTEMAGGVKKTPGLEGETGDATASLSSASKTPAEQSINTGVSIRIDEKRSASLCDDLITVELKSVWKQKGGKPKGIVTVSSSSIDSGKAVVKIGEALPLSGGCNSMLIDTGRDSKYYAIFQ